MARDGGVMISKILFYEALRGLVNVMDADDVAVMYDLKKHLWSLLSSHEMVSTRNR